MQLNNVNKNRAGNIIIIISLILVFICIALVISSSANTSHSVKWNDMKCFVQPDAEYSIEGDKFIMKSPFKTHNLELKKTKDLTNYENNIRKNFNGVAKYPYNSTHSYLMNSNIKYGAIVPTNSIDKVNGDPYKLKGSPEIIEVTGENSAYMAAFVLSSSSTFTTSG